jgi:anti-sigma factor RsiW
MSEPGSPRPVDETMLHAYLDGELDTAGRAEVEQWLARHPDDAARLAAYGRQKAALHAAFDRVTEETVPTRLLQAARRRRRTLAPWARIAAAIALILAGAAAGWFGRGYVAGPNRAVTLAERAIGAHVIYTAEVRHAVEVTSAEEEHLVRWLSRRLGQPLKLPDLRPVGFRCMGGRLLPDDGRPAAQFMYEDETGRRLTLYLRVIPDGRDTAFRFVHERDVSAFYWIDGKFGYALTANLPRDRLLQVATAVYEAGPK